MRQVKRPSTPIVKTVTVDVIEGPAPGVVTITEIEETEVRGTLGESEQQYAASSQTSAAFGAAAAEG